MTNINQYDLAILSFNELTVLKERIDSEYAKRKSVQSRIKQLNIQFLNTVVYVSLNDSRSVVSFHTKLEAEKDANIRPYSLCYTQGFKDVLGKEFCVLIKDGPIGIRLLRVFANNILEVDFMGEKTSYNFALFDFEGVNKRMARLDLVPNAFVQSNLKQLPELKDDEHLYQLIVSDERGVFPGHYKFLGHNLGQAYLSRFQS